MKSLPLFCFLILSFAFSNLLNAKTVHYELVTQKKPINISGKKTVDFALQVNGGIPGPILEFTEGDTAEIVVRNEIPDDELSIHWHGILLPSEMDGVPYVTTPPIRSGESYTFRFKLRQHGTYWYHSHTNVQEQKGVYGAIVIHPKNKKISHQKEAVLVLSDWSDENALDILKNLRKDGDYYLYKKQTIRSWFGALSSGKIKNFVSNEWSRMGGMDLSDVGYDAFLINGKRDSQLLTAHPGETVRLRIINAAASTYFTFALGNSPMKIISADGVDIKPVLASEVLIGMAETYDVLFTVPEHKNYEFRATAQDGTGYASTWIGMGEKIHAPDKAIPDLYATMDHSSMGHGSGHQMNMMNHESKMKHDMGHEDHGNMNHQSMDHQSMGHQMPMNHEAHQAHSEDKNSKIEKVKMLTVEDISSPSSTEFPKKSKIHEVKLVLGGDMSRYIWFINDKPIQEDRTIEINEGDVVRFSFINQTMMHHPMHLHGHFFRVINKNGDHSPLKHTVDVPPHSNKVIEFLANEPGEWMLHCHNLYHLKTGMARVVKYSSFTPKDEIKKMQKHDPHNHDHWYFYGTAEVATNLAQVNLRTSQTRNQFEVKAETQNSSKKSFSMNGSWEFEGDIFYRRFVSQFFSFVGGATVFDKNTSGIVGVSYLLPMMIETQLLLDHHGKIRIDLEKKFQWTSSIFSEVEATFRQRQKNATNSSFEYKVSLMYSPSWSWATGVIATDDNIGVGAKFQF